MQQQPRPRAGIQSASPPPVIPPTNCHSEEPATRNLKLISPRTRPPQSNQAVRSSRACPEALEGPVLMGRSQLLGPGLGCTFVLREIEGGTGSRRMCRNNPTPNLLTFRACAPPCPISMLSVGRSHPCRIMKPATEAPWHTMSQNGTRKNSPRPSNPLWKALEVAK